MPDLKTWPQELQSAFTRDAFALAKDALGRNKVLDMVVPGALHVDVRGQGVWEGVVSQNEMTILGLPTGTGNVDLTPALLAADFIGYGYGQDAGLAYVPTPHAPVGKSQPGVALIIDSGTVDIEAIRDALPDTPMSEFTMPDGRQTFHILNMKEGIAGKERTAWIGKIRIALEPVLKSAQARMRDFNAHAKLNFGGENGADYLRRLGQAGRPDLQDGARRLRSEFTALAARYRARAQGQGKEQEAAGQVGPQLLAARPSEQMGAPEEQPQIPPKVEVGGGEYSTAELGNLSPQVANVMVTGLSALEKQVADQRGGPRTWSEIDASKNRRSYQQAYHDLINRRLGGIAGDKQMDAFGDLVVSAGTELSAALDEVNRTGSAQSIVRAAAAREKYGLLAAPYAGYKTELGRGLAIIRKTKSRMQQADQIFEALGDGTEQAIKDFARSAKGKNLTQLLDQTAASYQPTVQDQFREYWINSILSGPWTHVVNIASNNLFVALESVAELATSLVSKDISTRAALARVTGMLSGMQLGAANFGKALKTGDPQLSQNMQIEQERRNAIPGKIGHIIRFPGRALTAADEFAKAMAFTGQLHYMAMEEAQKRNPENPHAVFEEVLRSYANNDAVQFTARQHADRMTFQKDLGPIGKKMMELRTKLGPVGWLLVPFVRTPTNIVKEFAKFTPAGLAMPSVLSDLNLPGAPRARAMGRMLVGSTVMAGAVSLVVQGLMTGNGPPDKTRRDAWLLTGRKPYSVKVGDQWIKYNRLEPVGMLLGMAADMTEMGRAAMLSDQQGEKLATMMLASFMTNLADKTFLRGIVDFTQAATDPGRYMAQWASSMAGSMIPNIVAQVARGMDPYVREGRNFLDSLQARVPGMREDLPAKLDLSGQPIQNSVVEPFASATAKNDPLAETMLQLDAAKGAPSRTLTIQGHRYEMTGDEYESYMGFAQQARWNVLTPIVSSPGFKQLASADSLKARDAFEQLWDKVGSQARDVWLLKHPEVVRKISQQAISQNSSTYVQ